MVIRVVEFSSKGYKTQIGVILRNGKVSKVPYFVNEIFLIEEYQLHIFCYFFDNKNFLILYPRLKTRINIPLK